MSKSLRPDDPNLQAARLRLRRIQWTWAVAFLAMAALSLLGPGGPAQRPGSLALSVVWLAGAGLLASGPQPALLVLVAAGWSLSLVFLLPGVAGAIGADPLDTVLGGSTVETVAGAAVRLLLAVTAWNQFLFYRMLYGTSGSSGLDANLPSIPEVVANRSDRLAIWSGRCALAGLALVWGAAVLASAGRPALGLGWGLAVFGIGLGLGAAFSPTARRGTALAGAGLGLLTFLSTLWVARILQG